MPVLGAEDQHATPQHRPQKIQLLSKFKYVKIRKTSPDLYCLKKKTHTPTATLLLVRKIIHDNQQKGNERAAWSTVTPCLRLKPQRTVLPRRLQCISNATGRGGSAPEPHPILFFINNNLVDGSKTIYMAAETVVNLAEAWKSLGEEGNKQAEHVLTQSPQIPSRFPLLTAPGCLQKRRRWKNGDGSVGSAWSAGEYCLSERGTGSFSGRSRQQEIT